MTLAKFGVRKLLIFAASLMAMILLAGVLTVSVAQPALAQQEEEGGEGDGGGGWGQRLCDGASLVPAPGTGLICDTGRAAVDRVGGGEDGGDGGGSPEEGGSGDGGDGSTGGGFGQGGEDPGGEPGPGAEAGQGTDDTAGKYGVWTEPINIAQGLVFICAGIGLAAGILTVGTAGGSRERHQKGIEIIGNTLAGFILGTLAVQIYNVLGDVVVGF